MALPGHSSVLVLFGCMVAGVGWLALNMAGAVLFSGISLDKLPFAVLNTILSASAAGLVSALITRIQLGSRMPPSRPTVGWAGWLP